MEKKSVSQIVDGLLEGKELSDFLTNPNKTSLVGKKIAGCNCPSCGEEDCMVVTDVITEDQNFYTVMAKCLECEEPAELELVLREDGEMKANDEALTFEGRVYSACNEGLMNGNYLKFNNGTVGYVTQNEKGENIITFVQPEEGQDYKTINNRVTFKVISFRNGMAKIISMVNDNAGKFPAGTLFYADKNELQRQAKVSKPRQNTSLDGRFKY